LNQVLYAGKSDEVAAFARQALAEGLSAEGVL
jgi:hypothetical protein